MPRHIAVLTGTRAEYGLLRWTLEAIRADRELELQLVVTGAHLVPEHGFTVKEIREDGFAPDEQLEILIASDTGAGTAKSMALLMASLADAFQRRRPDCLLVLGDRFETFAAASAATAMGIPLAHMCGGESTEGAIDECWRHGISKLAHLHFPAIPAYGTRLAQMGEQEARIHVVGSPGLENIRRLEPMRRDALYENLGLQPDQPVVVVTFHPVTTELEDLDAHLDGLFGALDTVAGNIVFTAPNADAGGRRLRERIDRYCAERPRSAHMFASLGVLRYLSLLRCASAMIGNSSSGLIEAPSFELPTVNIGSRQQGRVRGKNVIDTAYATADVKKAVETALSPAFRKSLQGSGNPYGDGHTSAKVVDVLRRTTFDRAFIQKTFVDR